VYQVLEWKRKQLHSSQGRPENLSNFRL
jgi:hypothetical protein